MLRDIVLGVGTCIILTFYIDWLVLRRLIEAKRPVEYDPRLRPQTEINAESYG